MKVSVDQIKTRTLRVYQQSGVLLQLPSDVDATNLIVPSKSVANQINQQVRGFHEKLMTVPYDHSRLLGFREKILHLTKNSTISATTKKTPNEAVYGFTPMDVTKLLSGTAVKQALSLPIARIELSDAIDLAAMTSKFYYDNKHKAVFFDIGDPVYLRLSKGYSVPAEDNGKLQTSVSTIPLTQ